MQTAQIIFNNETKEQAWLRDGCQEHLLDNIYQYKEDGKNLVLVTHSTCINRLGKKQGKKLIKMNIHSEKAYGASVFMTVDKEERKADVLGYVLDNEWNDFIKGKAV